MQTPSLRALIMALGAATACTPLKPKATNGRSDAGADAVAAATAPHGSATALAAPAGLTAAAVSASEIDLAWSAASGGGAVKYRLYRDGAPLAEIVAPSVAYRDQGLAPTTSHAYAVSAVDAQGHESAQSAAATATTPALTIVDTTPPSVPANVVAAAAGGDAIRLSWSAATDNAGGSGVRIYRVYRQGAKVAEVQIPATSYLDTNLAAGTVYQYQVSAVDVAGNESALSATVATSPAAVDGAALYGQNCAGCHGPLASSQKIGVTAAQIQSALATQSAMSGVAALTSDEIDAIAAALLASPDQAPSAPAGLAATAASGSQVDLSWSATANGGSSGLRDYRVYRNGILVAEQTALTFADTSLSAGTTYVYDVSAIDYAGNESAPSAPATATTPRSADTTPPSVPQGLAAVAVSASEIDLSWQAASDNPGGSGLAGYRIYQGNTQIGTVSVPGTSYADTGLPASTQLSYTVVAVDVAGNASAASVAAVATTLGLPDAFLQIAPMGTRLDAASVYASVFVSGVQPATATDTSIATLINSLIGTQTSAFAGPCWRYDGPCPGGAGANDVNVQASMLPLPDALRYGYSARGCEEILSIDGAVTNVLTKAGLTTASPANDQAVSTLFAIFYPGRPVSATALGAVETVFAQASAGGMSTLDAWRYTLVPLCKSVAFGMF